MHDLEDVIGRQHLREWGEVRERERIDAERFIGGRDLHQAQLRTVSAFAQEFGIEPDARKRSETCRERGEGGRGGDYGVLQT